MPVPAAAPRSEDKREACIGGSVVLKGELTGSENLTVDGCVEGRIDLRDHALIIGPNARIQATIVAKVVTIFGTVTGEVTAREMIEIRKGATLLGNLKSPRLAIQEGASFSGNVEMGDRRTKQPAAVAV